MLGTIRELIRLVVSHPPENPHLLFPRKTADDDFNRLFFLLHSGGHHSDEEVAQALYGYTDPILRKRYFTLKSRLKERIEQSLLFLRTERIPRRIAAEHQAFKDMAVIRLICVISSHHYAQSRLEKLLEYAQRTDLTNVEIFALEYLLLSDKTVEMAESAERLQRLLLLYERKSAEIRGTLMLQRLLQQRERDSIVNPSQEPLCREIMTIVADARQRADSIGLQILALRSEALAAEAMEKFDAALRINAQHIAVCRAHPHFHDPFTLGELYEEQLRFGFLSKKNVAGQNSMTEVFNLAPDVPERFQRSAEYALLTALHEPDWQRVSTIYREIAVLPEFDIQMRDGQVVARWRLYEEWLMYLIPDFVPIRSRRRSARRPLSELRRKGLHAAPKPTKTDIVEMNSSHYQAFAMCTLQILTLLAHREFDLVRDNKPVIESYYEKYLRKSALDYRAQIFLRMILQAVKTNFDASETIRLTERYYRWLIQSHPVDPIKTGVMEIIPFEQVWMLIIYYLQHKQTDIILAPNEILVKKFDPIFIGQNIYGSAFSSGEHPL